MSARWAPLVVLVAACAPSSAALLRPVSTELAARGLPAVGAPGATQVGASAEARALLAQPLTLDSALRVALLQNRRLAAYAEELGVARAELTGATVPALELAADYHLGTFEVDALTDVLALLELPTRRAGAQAGLARVRAATVGHAVRLATEVELAFGELQAALAKVELQQQYFEAADAAALVHERAQASGGSTELAVARQHEQRETARLMLGRAQLEVLVAKERLGRALGISAVEGEWTVAPTPPSLPTAAPALDDLEREAVAASTELAMGRASANERARRAGLSGLRRFLPGLYLGAVAEYHDDGWAAGPAARLVLPLGGGPVATARRDQAHLRQAQHELYATAVELRSMARAARLTALGTYAEAAQLRDVVVPLRRRILDETLLHYNAMNADTITLLLAQQALVEGQRLLVEATARHAAAMAQVAALRRGVMAGSTSSVSTASESTERRDDAAAHGLH